MKLIIGLGNPGKEYEQTPHNVGFRVIDALKSTLQRSDQYTEIGEKKEKNSMLHEYWFVHENSERERIVCMKPSVYMNESGSAVAEYMRMHTNQLDVAHDLWLVHDDGDIALGAVRLDKNKRSAGHRGVRSVFDALGTDTIIRFRVGIRPEGNREKTEEYVLRRPSSHQMASYAAIQARVAQGIMVALAEGIQRATVFLHKKPLLEEEVIQP